MCFKVRPDAEYDHHNWSKGGNDQYMYENNQQWSTQEDYGKGNEHDYIEQAGVPSNDNYGGEEYHGASGGEVPYGGDVAGEDFDVSGGDFDGGGEGEAAEPETYEGGDDEEKAHYDQNYNYTSTAATVDPYWNYHQWVAEGEAAWAGEEVYGIYDQQWYDTHEEGYNHDHDDTAPWWGGSYDAEGEAEDHGYDEGDEEGDDYTEEIVEEVQGQRASLQSAARDEDLDARKNSYYDWHAYAGAAKVRQSIVMVA
ncbi:unnamed protein product [Amoebophrya sp. A25]|nr:unnamed protein product [Amoebophrya sp. A25]|eukprot:GSA25T00003056001.1